MVVTVPLMFDTLINLNLLMTMNVDLSVCVYFLTLMYSIPQTVLQMSSRSLSLGVRSSFEDSPRSCGPIILPNGTIQVRLRNGIRFIKKIHFANDRSS